MPTSLLHLANLYGTDKGSLASNAHVYTGVYELLFAGIRDKPVGLLEIGLQIGGREGQSGASRRTVSDAPSVRMWLDYFPSAKIYGFDISDFSFIELERFTFIQGDAGDIKDLKRVKSVCQNNLDIIIDDGSHASFHQQLGFVELFDALRPGGIYIIEDLHWQPPSVEKRYSVPKTVELFETYLTQGGFSDTGQIDIQEYRKIEEAIGSVTLINDRGLSSSTAKLAIIRKKSSTSDPDKLDCFGSAYSLAHFHWRQGNVDKAIKFARQATDEDPEHFDSAITYLRFEAHSKGANIDTLNLAHGLAKRFPNRVEGLALLATILSQCDGRISEAIDAQENACRLAPESLDQKIKLAYLMQRAGRIEDARCLAEQLIFEHPDNQRAKKLIKDLDRSADGSGP